jgi:hypothetical protein
MNIDLDTKSWHDGCLYNFCQPKSPQTSSMPDMKSQPKFLSGFAAVGLLMALTHSASALSINITRVDGYFSGNGGEFSITAGDAGSVAEINAIKAGYDIKATAGGGFETFCLEYGEGISAPGGPYNAGITRGAMAGGPGAVGGTDLVSLGTAHLYTEFARGVLANYDYTNLALRPADALELQQAFWFLEQEIGLSDSEIAGNDFLAHIGITSNADSDLAIQRGNNDTTAAGLFNDVWVLNLGPANQGFPNQDQLIYYPHGGYSVPDGGSTAMLLGCVLSGLAFLKRKLA